jgi:hypothetical protein
MCRGHWLWHCLLQQCPASLWDAMAANSFVESRSSQVSPKGSAPSAAAARRVRIPLCILLPRSLSSQTSVITTSAPRMPMMSTSAETVTPRRFAAAPADKVNATSPWHGYH